MYRFYLVDCKAQHFLAQGVVSQGTGNDGGAQIGFGFLVHGVSHMVFLAVSHFMAQHHGYFIGVGEVLEMPSFTIITWPMEQAALKDSSGQMK